MSFKIELKIEKDGNAILFLPYEIERDKTIACYSRIGQHSSASRAYMRSCKPPTTKDDWQKCHILLREWANQPF